ncbi:MAG: GNAT family N-acetyltransferase [Prolixibacteraceae bacterium]|nr:GNAT family N-acetyltransferase [Prolixibacteraceae bacterium]
MNQVHLRPLRYKDANRLAQLANNKKISMNLRDGFPYPYTLADAKKFIEICKNHTPVQVFAIECNGEYAGNIGLYPGEDVYRRSAEIGYFLGESYWGKGIMTKAVKQMVEYGFSNLNIVRIYTGVFEYNKASQRVLEKCGFKKEAVFEKAIYKNHQLWNEVRFAILKPMLQFNNP